MRVRTLVVLVAIVCAVFAGSTSAVNAERAGSASISAASGRVPDLHGKRWDLG